MVTYLWRAAGSHVWTRPWRRNLDMVLSPVGQPSIRTPSRMNWLHSFYCVGAVVTVVAGTLALQAGGRRVASLLLIPLPIALVCVLGAMSFPALTTEGEERIPLRGLFRSICLSGLLAPSSSGCHRTRYAQWLPACRNLARLSPVGRRHGSLAFSLAMAVGRMGIGTLSTRLDSYTISVELWPLRRPVPRGFVLPCCPSRSACLHSGRSHRQLPVAHYARHHCRSLSQRRCQHVWSSSPHSGTLVAFLMPLAVGAPADFSTSIGGFLSPHSPRSSCSLSSSFSASRISSLGSREGIPVGNLEQASPLFRNIGFSPSNQNFPICDGAPIPPGEPSVTTCGFLKV